MPLNLLKKYNALLDIVGMEPRERDKSLLAVFNRDIADNPYFAFRGKRINPTPADGDIAMAVLFTHLTTRTVNNEKKREFEIQRSIRLHWIKHHTSEQSKEKITVFSVQEPQSIRTYIYDKVEDYVIVLEPLRKKAEYFLITAFKLEGKDRKRNSIMKKYGRRLDEVF